MPSCTHSSSSLLVSHPSSPFSSRRSRRSGAQKIVAAKGASAAEEVLKDPKWPSNYPFSAKDMERYDEDRDAVFYSQPRFVTHIDEGAIGGLTKYYDKAFREEEKKLERKIAVLDICSSWISHYPENFEFERCAGTGMNEEELNRNPVFTEKGKVADLNEIPRLPYEDNSFDFVTNCVSIDYLTKPLEVMCEVRRVLKPGGRAIMSFSNRCFPTKVVSIWTSTGDIDHVWIVGAYFHYAKGFEAPEAFDISPKTSPLNPFPSDPMYIVTAHKVQEEGSENEIGTGRRVVSTIIAAFFSLATCILPMSADAFNSKTSQLLSDNAKDYVVNFDEGQVKGRVKLKSALNRSSQEIVTLDFSGVSGIPDCKHRLNAYDDSGSFNPELRPYGSPTSIKKFGASACHFVGGGGCILNRHIGDLGNITVQSSEIKPVKDMYVSLIEG